MKKILIVPTILISTLFANSLSLENNKNGFLVKNRNAEEMITKIEELLNDSSKMQYFSKNSKNTALKFSKEAISKEWNKFLNNI
mgnify:CR=1 FL=1